MSIVGPYENSPHRCPRDGKRLVVEIGQHADLGTLEEHHFCLHCDYVHRGPRPPIPTRRRYDAGERLYQLRTGGLVQEVPMVYSTEPFPAQVWEVDGAA